MDPIKSEDESSLTPPEIKGQGRDLELNLLLDVKCH